MVYYGFIEQTQQEKTKKKVWGENKMWFGNNKNKVKILYEDIQGRIHKPKYYKRVEISNKNMVRVKKEQYILKENFKLDHKGIPYYKVKEGEAGTQSWESGSKIKNESALTTTELDSLVESKLFMEVMQMTKGSGLNMDWKMIGLILGIGLIVLIIVLKLIEGNV